MAMVLEVRGNVLFINRHERMSGRRRARWQQQRYVFHPAVELIMPIRPSNPPKTFPALVDTLYTRLRGGGSAHCLHRC